MKVKFGVDVGGTTVKIGLFDMENTLIWKGEIDTDKTDNGNNILGKICDKLREVLDSQDLDLADLAGVGIGLPGPVTEDGRILGCVNLGWGIFNIEKTMSDILMGVPVKAGNDANVAALGEQSFGGGKGHDNVVMITLGTGVGGGIILGGKIVTGTNGAAGEIGHIPVNPHETMECNCGKCGCLEQYASASGIKRLAEKYIKEGEASSYLEAVVKAEEKGFTAKDVMDGAKKGDSLCIKVAEEMSRYLGMALAGVASVVNPDCMVIGGGVSKAGQYIIDLIEKYFMQYAFVPCRNVTFRLAELENDAGIYGAAGLIQS